ncbi:MAG: hypothetical protein HOP11_01635 [Saprospiraceae bacterium]|nr:hypothetical protein [Saprospiraceae bacterium]
MSKFYSLFLLTLIFYSCGGNKNYGPPEWLKTLSVYEIMPKNFSPTQNINGIREALPKIRTVYANAISFTPLTPNDAINTSFNPGDPYAALDYSKLDSTLGTDAELKSLIEEAHLNRFKVIFQFEISYTGPNHEWRTKKPQYYKSVERKVSGLYNKQYIQLDYSNPKVRKEILKILSTWKSKFKPDGIIILNTEDLPTEFNQDLVNTLKSENFLLASGSNIPIVKENAIYDSYFDKSLYSVFKKLSRDSARSSDFKALFEINKSQKNKSSSFQFTRTSALNEYDDSETQIFQNYYKLPALLSISLCGIPWILNGQEEPMFVKIDVAKPTFVERNYQYSLEFYRSLFIHRKENIALHSLEDNLPVLISDSEDVLAFERKNGNMQFVVFANLRDTVSSFRVTKNYNQYMEFFTRNKVDFITQYEYKLGPHQFIALTNKY